MDSTCSQSRVRSPFTPSNRNHTTASRKRKTIKQVESLAGELIASLKAINSQGPDFVNVPNTQNLAPASECRKIYNSPKPGSNTTNNNRTNDTNDFNCPSTHNREEKRAWNLIYEDFKQGKFRTSPTHHIEQLRKPATCEPMGGISLSPAAKKSLNTHWEVKSESAKEEIMDEEMGTSLQEAGWADENFRRAEFEDESTEQERMGLAVIDYSDDELDSESDTDSDDEDDFPHIYADIPFQSRLTPPDPPILKCSEPESSEILETPILDDKRELTLITALINDLGDRLVNYQELTDNIFVAALYNANPEPVLLSLKSFCSWKLHPFSDRMKDTLPPGTQTIPAFRLIYSDGDVYSLEERMEILDEIEDQDFARHLAERDKWQEYKERWLLRECTAAENEARLQHLERWYEEGRAK